MERGRRRQVNPEAQRIAIAIACGWRIEDKDGTAFVYSPNDKTFGNGYTGQPITYRKTLAFLPDYLNDLNAMHEAAMALSAEDRTQMRKELQWIIAPNTKPGPTRSIVLMCSESYDKWFYSTAAQRAEAFLRTIGKWEGGDK